MSDYTLDVDLTQLPRGWKVMGFGDGLALAGPGPALDKVRAQIAEVSAIRAIVDEQAEDEALWFVAKTTLEAYLQTALRWLHEIIEGRTGDEIALDLVSTQPRTESDGETDDTSPSRLMHELEETRKGLERCDELPDD